MSAIVDQNRTSPSDESGCAREQVQLAALYQELRSIAMARMRGLSPGQTLSATVLINEAYLKLARTNQGSFDAIWHDKNTFLSVASEAMRQVVIDYYRRRQRLKRGGGLDRIRLDVEHMVDSERRIDVLELNEALDRLEITHPEKSQLVKLRFFAGMTMPECARAMDISLATAERHWRYARAWLAEALKST